MIHCVIMYMVYHTGLYMYMHSIHGDSIHHGSQPCLVSHRLSDAKLRYGTLVNT